MTNSPSASAQPLAPPEAGRRIRVLLYHRALPEGARETREFKFISARAFRTQIGLLERWGFTPITFTDYRLILEGELSPPGSRSYSRLTTATRTHTRLPSRFCRNSA